MKIKRTDSQRGFSLIEVAITMVLIFVAVAAIVRMVGGPKPRIIQGDQSFASTSQYAAFKSKEFLLADSMIESIFAGDLRPMERPADAGLATNNACGIPLAGVTEFTSIGGTCVNTSSRGNFFYRWAIRRIIQGNDVPGNFSPLAGPSLVGGGPGFERRIAIPVGNEYYIGTLRFFANQNDADNGNNPTVTLPFSIFYNTQEPSRIEAHVASTLVFDTSGSMLEFDPTVGSRSFWLKGAFNEFVTRLENDPFVSDRSMVGLATFQGGESLAESIKIAGGAAFTGVVNPLTATQPPLNRETREFNPLLRDTINCIDPDETVVDHPTRGNICETSTQSGRIDFKGDTKFSDGLVSGKEAINTLTLGGNFNQDDFIVYNSQLFYDRFVILVSDGCDKSGAQTPHPSAGDPGRTCTADATAVANLTPMVRMYSGEVADDSDPFTGVRRLPRQRITLFTVGMVDPVAPVLTAIAEETPHGVFYQVDNVDDLINVFIQIENQFQFFALKRKPERYRIFI